MPKNVRVRTPVAETARKMAGKPPSLSRTEMIEVVLPNDANLLGNILGGRVMHLIDITGAIAAHRHSNSHVVTASVDYIDFRSPIKVGDLILLRSEVNRAFHTSIEVGVEVFSRNWRAERKLGRCFLPASPLPNGKATRMLPAKCAPRSIPSAESTGKRTHTSSAYVTYVAIDANNQPHPVPPVLPQTAAERRRYRQAGIRRRIRLAHRYGKNLEVEATRLEKRGKK